MATVTLHALTNDTVATGGTAVEAVPAAPTGGVIQNPYTAEDEGVAPAAAEPIYVDPINSPGSAPGAGWGTTFVIYPGQTWTVIPGQSTITRMNAPTSGHHVSGIYW